MKAICARIMAASRIPADPEGKTQNSRAAAKPLLIASLIPHFILQEVFPLYPERPH